MAQLNQTDTTAASIANPDAGDYAWFTDGGILYLKDSAGVVVAVGSALPPGSVTLAEMADLAQDQFIGRVTASTGVPETATITAAARTVLDDATVAAMLTTLGGQPLDADLTAIAALASAADKLPYATGAQAWALTTLTAFARTLLDDADALSARATLGITGSDTYANRPAAAAGNAGMLYFATDIGIAPGCLFRSTGSAWEQVGECVLYEGYSDITLTANQATTSLLTGGTGSLTVPANAASVGTEIEIEITGKATNAAGASGATCITKLGATTVATCPTNTQNVIGTNYPVLARSKLAFRTIGASADIVSFIEDGWFYAAGRQWLVQSAVAADPTANTVDSTAALAIDFQNAWAGGAGDTYVAQRARVTVTKLT